MPNRFPYHTFCRRYIEFWQRFIENCIHCAILGRWVWNGTLIPWLVSQGQKALRKCASTWLLSSGLTEQNSELIAGRFRESSTACTAAWTFVNTVNPLKPREMTLRTGGFDIKKFHVLPTQSAFLCFVCIPEQTVTFYLYSINCLVLYNRDGVFNARYGLDLYIQFYVLPTHCICVFCVDLRTNSDYFPIQH